MGVIYRQYLNRSVDSCTGPDTCASVAGLPLSACLGQNLDLAFGAGRFSICPARGGTRVDGHARWQLLDRFQRCVDNYIEMPDGLRHDGIFRRNGHGRRRRACRVMLLARRLRRRFKRMREFAIRH
jgi:hypothetical protein